nr:Uncharacterised protein [Klebsiella pneumoniae]
MHIAHIAAKHHHVPLLDGPRPGDQRKQARFADAVRANQANHTPCRDRQTDIAQRDGGAKLLTNMFQQGDGGEVSCGVSFIAATSPPGLQARVVVYPAVRKPYRAGRF